MPAATSLTFPQFRYYMKFANVYPGMVVDLNTRRDRAHDDEAQYNYWVSRIDGSAD